MKKITKKFGIALTCITFLGGVVVPTLTLSTNNIVYAEDTQKPIEVAIIAVTGDDGPQSHYYVTINPGETKVVTAPEVKGYKVDQYTEPTYTLTYDYALRLFKDGGFAWVQFWMVKDETTPSTPNVPQPGTPKPETPKPEEPKPDVPKPNVPQPGTPKPGTPKPETPKPDTSKSETSTTESPKTKAPTTETSTTESPTTEAPTTEAPTTEASKTSQESKKILPKTGQASSLLGVVGMSALTCLGLLGLAKTKRRS